ncbi:cytidylate kinase [Paenibacillus sp. 32O-W]|uniref:(d)CMP kinase n=1 Tax=Paenibacillus sp. 32O-W TaxID=1695218 RepID=UPI000721FEC7|nr:(d)CMP kinase [Paenibacillus sp. 32O-W]ALS27744.1 cytidylate kinase [Paenibacillus sp. 32O-W]
MMQQDGGRERINIAIDGPAGAGKSTVARKVAEQLGYVYIDTGAMYRAVTLSALRSGIDPLDGPEIASHAASLDIRLLPGEQGQKVLLNGEDVTEEIRSREVTQNVSQVAANGAVRRLLAEKQRRLADRKGVVMDGRDIGSHVLPDAELKVFLTASASERALRRYREIGDAQGVSLEQLEREIEERDRMDRERDVSPLVCASDAVVLDSTAMTIEEVCSAIVSLSRTKLAEAK